MCLKSRNFDKHEDSQMKLGLSVDAELAKDIRVSLKKNSREQLQVSSKCYSHEVVNFLSHSVALASNVQKHGRPREKHYPTCLKPDRLYGVRMSRRRQTPALTDG